MAVTLKDRCQANPCAASAERYCAGCFSWYCPRHGSFAPIALLPIENRKSLPSKGTVWLCAKCQTTYREWANQGRTIELVTGA